MRRPEFPFTFGKRVFTKAAIEIVAKTANAFSCMREIRKS
jgi:hypothetical protein